MDKDRMLHSLGVAKKMVEIGKKLNLSDKELKELYVIGINHDIGYEFDKDNHGICGANILKDMGFKYYNEIYYHGEIDIDYNSLYLDILNMADMMIDKSGNDLGYEGRLKDIESRYGAYSLAYKKCCILVNNLKDKYKKI